jgi:hypothetical protein
MRAPGARTWHGLDASSPSATEWFRMERRLALACALLLALAGSSCGWLDDVEDSIEDHLKSCHDWTVTLVNDEQTLGPAHIIGPKESPLAENLLQSGQSREISLCLELGRSYGFRAVLDDKLLGVVNCPASRRHYDNIDVEVRWTPVGFRCVSW